MRAAWGTTRGIRAWCAIAEVRSHWHQRNMALQEGQIGPVGMSR